MIYLIGGPPRVGKTTLVNELVRRHPMHAVSTDAIRYMLRRAIPRDALDPDIFIHFGVDVMTLWDRSHEQTLDEQNRQSKALWPAITEFIKSYDEDGIDLIVEGVAVLPEFVEGLGVPNRVLFIGNTSQKHIAVMNKVARDNAHDWMHALADADIEKASNFFRLFSGWLKEESAVKNMRYQEISDDDFSQSLKAAADYLLND